MKNEITRKDDLIVAVYYMVIGIPLIILSVLFGIEVYLVDLPIILLLGAAFICMGIFCIKQAMSKPKKVVED